MTESKSVHNGVGRWRWTYCKLCMIFAIRTTSDNGLPQFNEHLIRQGIEGGKAAANELRQSILSYTVADSDNVEIVAKICANVTGLAKAMKREGLLDDGEDLRNFTLGFTQGKASFDFVDVGHGKERADSKVKGTLLGNCVCFEMLTRFRMYKISFTQSQL